MNLEALKSLRQRIEVETPEGTVALLVKGYSLADITKLFSIHASVMAELYHHIEKEDFEVVLARAIQTVPSFIEDAVAVALGLDWTSEEAELINLIPASKQMEILRTAGRLTFRTEKELGELVEAVRSLAAAAVQEFARQSSSGSGNSESSSVTSKKTATKKRGATRSA
jgi:hypothetical protein